jgi:hypothetical protein
LHEFAVAVIASAVNVTIFFGFSNGTFGFIQVTAVCKFAVLGQFMDFPKPLGNGLMVIDNRIKASNAGRIN